MYKTISENLTVGDSVALGSYPQSEVKDEEVLRAAKKPFGKFCDRMKYDNCWGSGEVCDFAYNGNRYRSVITKRFKEKIFYKISGYRKGRTYVFAYEPILWRVLLIRDGQALLASEKVLDAQPFQHPEKQRTIDGITVYPNNYAHSGVRKWLNGTFFNTAFSDEEKARIVLTTVKNSAETTKKPINEYACDDTADKVFLLSFQEAAALFADNKSRWKKASDYVKAQGCYAYGTHDAKYSNACWWLRSPDHKYNNIVRCVGDGGGIGDGGFSTSHEPSSTADGVAPAIIVKIN